MITVTSFSVHFNGTCINYDRQYNLDDKVQLERLRMRLKRMFQGAVIYFNYVTYH